MNIVGAGELQNVSLQELHTAVEAQHVCQDTQSMFLYLISTIRLIGHGKHSNRDLSHMDEDCIRDQARNSGN
jgi:hypothetical protein